MEKQPISIADPVVWEIDGEKFWPTLPTVDQICAYCDLLKDDAFTERLIGSADKWTHPSLLVTAGGRKSTDRSTLEFPTGRLDAHRENYHDSLTLSLLGSIDPQKAEFKTYSEKSFKIPSDSGWLDYEYVNPSSRLPWRPVLIPLDKHGKPDLLASRDNPDGTLVTGGSFYVGDEPAIYSSDVVTLVGYLDFFVGDTNEKNQLQWVWMDGRLVCTSALACVCIRSILEKGLISVPHLFPKKARSRTRKKVV